jgi:hypothetical protein
VLGATKRIGGNAMDVYIAFRARHLSWIRLYHGIYKS